MKAVDKEKYTATSIVTFGGDSEQLKTSDGQNIIQHGQASFLTNGIYIVSLQFQTELTQAQGRLKISMGNNNFVTEEEDKQQCPAIKRTVGGVYLLPVAQGINIHSQVREGVVNGENTFFSAILVFPEVS